MAMHHVSLLLNVMRALHGWGCACWAATGPSLQQRVCVAVAACDVFLQSCASLQVSHRTVLCIAVGLV